MGQWVHRHRYVKPPRKILGKDMVVFEFLFFFFPSYTWQGRCAALAARKCSDPLKYFAGPNLGDGLHKSPRSHTSLLRFRCWGGDMAVLEFSTLDLAVAVAARARSTLGPPTTGPLTSYSRQHSVPNQLYGVFN